MPKYEFTIEDWDNTISVLDDDGNEVVGFRWDNLRGNCGVVELYDFWEDVPKKDVHHVLACIHRAIVALGREDKYGKVVFSDNFDAARDAVSWHGIAGYLGAMQGSTVINPRTGNKIVVWEWDIPKK